MADYDHQNENTANQLSHWGTFQLWFQRTASNKNIPLDVATENYFGSLTHFKWIEIKEIVPRDLKNYASLLEKEPNPATKSEPSGTWVAFQNYLLWVNTKKLTRKYHIHNMMTYANHRFKTENKEALSGELSPSERYSHLLRILSNRYRLSLKDCLIDYYKNEFYPTPEKGNRTKDKIPSNIISLQEETQTGSSIQDITADVSTFFSSTEADRRQVEIEVVTPFAKQQFDEMSRSMRIAFWRKSNKQVVYKKGNIEDEYLYDSPKIHDNIKKLCLEIQTSFNNKCRILDFDSETAYMALHDLTVRILTHIHDWICSDKELKRILINKI